MNEWIDEFYDETEWTKSSASKIAKKEEDEKSVLISEHVLKSKGICSLSIPISPLFWLVCSFA